MRGRLGLRAFVAVLSALLGFSLGASSAIAQSSPRAAQSVVLVRPRPGDELFEEALHRLEAELALQGFSTTLVEPSDEDVTPAQLTAWVSAHGAFAGISLARRRGATTAEICVADRVTGKTSLRTLEIGTSRDAPTVLAVRAADLLRSSLREFAVDEKPPEDVVDVVDEPPPEEVNRWAREPAARFRLQARFAVVGLTQGIGPAFGPSLALSYRAFDDFWIGALATGPAVGAAFETPNGRASLDQALAVVRLLFVAYESPLFELRPLLAVGVYHFDAQGSVEPPLIGRSASVTSFAVGLGLELDFHLTTALTLGAEVSGYFTAPRPAIAILDEQYDFQVPLVTASLGMGVEF